MKEKRALVHFITLHRWCDSPGMRTCLLITALFSGCTTTPTPPVVANGITIPGRVEPLEVRDLATKRRLWALRKPTAPSREQPSRDPVGDSRRAPVHPREDRPMAHATRPVDSSGPVPADHD